MISSKEAAGVGKTPGFFVGGGGWTVGAIPAAGCWQSGPHETSLGRQEVQGKSVGKSPQGGCEGEDWTRK